MPNQQGGKNYKKSKHSTGDTVVRLEEAGPEELYGRVIKILGNLNMNVYCNDNKIRICKVRGAMRKRVWINIGDLVIISLRNFEAEEDKKAMTEAERKLIDRGDIVHKIEASLHSKAKKLAGINQKLFMQLENTDGKVLEEIGNKHSGQADANDCGIEFDEDARGEGEDDEDDDDESGKEEDGAPKPKKLKGKTRESKLAVATKRDQDDADLDLNIDDI